MHFNFDSAVWWGRAKKEMGVKVCFEELQRWNSRNEFWVGGVVGGQEGFKQEATVESGLEGHVGSFPGAHGGGRVPGRGHSLCKGGGRSLGESAPLAVAVAQGGWFPRPCGSTGAPETPCLLPKSPEESERRGVLYLDSCT